VLLPVMAPDAVLCSDGHATHERIAKDERIPHFALNAGRHSKRTPRSHHINTVNAIIGRFRSLMKPFCGPASKHLAAYGRWHVARDNAGRSHRDVLRLLLASGPRANTICWHCLSRPMPEPRLSVPWRVDPGLKLRINLLDTPSPAEAEFDVLTAGFGTIQLCL